MALLDAVADEVALLEDVDIIVADSVLKVNDVSVLENVEVALPEELGAELIDDVAVALEDVTEDQTAEDTSLLVDVTLEDDVDEVHEEDNDAVTDPVADTEDASLAVDVAASS